MESNLQAWMQQYAERFRNPQNLGVMAAAQGATMPGAAPPAQNLAAAAQPGATAAPPAAAPMPGADPMQATESEPIPGDGMDSDSFESHFTKQPAAAQNKQLDDLESRVGSIDKAYLAMAQQLGQRPSTKLSRKEKGMLIMEFGLQLMAQSAGSAHGGDVGGAVGEAGLNTMKSYRNQKAGKQQQAGQWDADQINLRAARNKEVDATTKDFRTEQRDQHREDMDQQRLENDDRRLDQTDQRLEDLESYRDRSMDDRENRTSNLNADGPGGSGGKPTAAIQNIEYLVKHGTSREVATRIVHKQIKDPKKAFEEIYKSARSRFANESDARAEARRIVEVLYGEGSIESALDPVVKPGNVQRKKSKSGRPMISRDGKTWEYED